MNLFYREFGDGEPLIILHGLYGSSDNWVSIAKELARNFRVIVVDQRNHGQSPHSKEHNYQVLSNDLLDLLNHLDIEKTFLLGHSMGGKTAMQFTAYNESRVKALVVVDIAPWSHFDENETKGILNDHAQIIKGLKAIPIASIISRNEADTILSGWVNQESIRQFLLKNLKRDSNGGFSWKLNLEAISENLPNLMDGVHFLEETKTCSTKTLFIKGEISDYISSNRQPELKQLFPNSELVVIPQVGHWVHAEKPKELLEAVLHFLKP